MVREALKCRGSLTIWFDLEMTFAPKPTRKRVRQPCIAMLPSMMA